MALDSYPGSPRPVGGGFTIESHHPLKMRTCTQTRSLLLNRKP